MRRAVTAAEAGRVIGALERCPRHPQWIVLPLFGLRTCCLIDLLTAVRDGDDERAREMADRMSKHITMLR